nr:DUF2798 domain-containing protein [uncultured Piscinibacter sp.]
MAAYCRPAHPSHAVGPGAQFAELWTSAWLTAWLVALPVALAVAPLARHAVEGVLERE